MYEVFWTQEAVDELFQLASRDRGQSARILTTVRTFGRDGKGDVKKLRGVTREWRLRIGDWRVRLGIDGSNVYVAGITDRRDAY